MSTIDTRKDKENSALYNTYSSKLFYSNKLKKTVSVAIFFKTETFFFFINFSLFSSIKFTSI